MQTAKKLLSELRQLADNERYLFTLTDLSALFPGASSSTFKSLLSRLVGRGDLLRICRGLYQPSWIQPDHGFVLYHAAARLRSGCFTYLSLESVLSEGGVIAQIPMQRVTLMTSGRGGTIDCGGYGVIEFTHTRQRPEQVMLQLSYDPERRLWCSNIKQALRDLRRTGRNLDLIQGEENE
ncbi:MAG: type IV toxin-antitoxin system AbiEi family antitoxin [Kiritimatiellia bacterium]